MQYRFPSSLIKKIFVCITRDCSVKNSMSNMDSASKAKEAMIQDLNDINDLSFGVQVTRSKPPVSKLHMKRCQKIAPNLRKILAGVNINCDNVTRQVAERSTYIVNSYINLIHLRVVMSAMSSGTSTQDQQSDQRLHDLYSMLHEHTACGLPPQALANYR